MQCTRRSRQTLTASADHVFGANAGSVPDGGQMLPSDPGAPGLRT